MLGSFFIFATILTIFPSSITALAEKYEDESLNDYDEMILNISDESPKKQIQMGVLTPDIKCGDGLHLVMKKTNAFPACVKNSTAETLIKRGWAMPENSMSEMLKTISDAKERIIEERNEILEEHRESLQNKKD